MNLHFLWIVLGLAVVVAALEVPRRNRAGLNRPWSLERVGTLLSEPEQVLYLRLAEALPHCGICPQVLLLRAVRIKRGIRNQSVLNQISQLSVDFLIVRPDTSIVAAVELDDTSHRRADRRNADARKTHALESAGIPLIRWEVGRIPDVATIRAAVGELANGSNATSGAPRRPSSPRRRVEPRMT
jgi:very-short-patch-repair endonuclease